MIPTVATRAIPAWLAVVTAVGLSALVGWLDYNADEVQGSVLLLLVFSGALAFVAPGRAWLTALILGSSVVAAHAVGSVLGVPARYPMTPPASGLLALVPAALGAGMGVAARALLRSATSR